VRGALQLVENKYVNTMAEVVHRQTECQTGTLEGPLKEAIPPNQLPSNIVTGLQKAKTGKVSHGRADSQLGGEGVESS
jgi:hypothetical protein